MFVYKTTNILNFFSYIIPSIFQKTKWYTHIKYSHFIYFLFVFFLSGRPTTLSELMGKAEMWLIRTYWDLEFPRPLLPHFEFVGGLHCKPAKPLPKVNLSMFVLLCLLCTFSSNDSMFFI